MPFDQRSLIVRVVWFPPCFVRQNQQKKQAILHHFQRKIFKSETTSYPYFSPKIPNLWKYWTSDFGKWGKKTFKRYLKCEQTDRHTYRRTDRRTDG